jgi:lysozyme
MAIRDWVLRKPTARAAGSIAAALAIAIPFVAAFEGYYPRVYRDPVGVKTICYGQTAADGANFSKVYTKAECEAMLGKDLARYDAMVRKCIPKVQPPHREAALISFVYNLGQGALCHSAVARHINAGNITAGCNAMLAYNHAGGRVLSGLTRRRQAERALCLRGD